MNAEEPANVPSDRFHNLSHALRTIALEQSPKGAERAVSIGASGRWYFDWFEQCVGPIKEHVGVEALEPMPEDLPPYVRWVTNTADHLDDVEDESADLVFAGQTTEHLWAHELAGFLLEAHRVLRAGGWLVLDSPNRLVTEHLRWSHGGHTVELSRSEMTELLDLAGFRVVIERGIWRCRFGSEVLALEEDLENDELTARRIATADQNPDDSFVWWLEAERLDTAPNGEQLRRRVNEMFRDIWPTRVSRGMWTGPPEDSLQIAAGASGLIAATLPFPLHAGAWELSVALVKGDPADARGLAAEIVAPGGAMVHRLDAPSAVVDHNVVSWRFVHENLWFALGINLLVDRVERPVTLAMPIDLSLVDAVR